MRIESDDEEIKYGEWNDYNAIEALAEAKS
jgi:hypothetical protein